MLIAIIKAQNIASVQQQIASLKNSKSVDGVELRLDYLPLEIRLTQAKTIIEMIKALALPWILTLRESSQGGVYQGDENTRLATLFILCDYAPTYVDIEYDVPLDFVQQLKSQYPHVQLIRSYHNFESTPENLSSILQTMVYPIFASYKIATYAHTTIDALNMLIFLQAQQRQSSALQLTGICMGEAGCSTRVVARIFGNQFTYASITEDNTTAAGQLSLSALNDIYQVQRLNAHTKIYALLGDPIEKSIGHLLHNRAFRYLKQNAVYIKLATTKAQCAKVLAMLMQLRIGGLSVTMPLKEILHAYLVQHPEMGSVHNSALPIRAINTLILEQGKYVGFNTDGLGAMHALLNTYNQALHNKTIVILGAGGAARSIAFAAKDLGAKIIIINRSASRALKLAQELNCQTAELKMLRQLKYDVVINTIPINIVGETDLLRGSIAMDIVYQPVITEFLQVAKAAQCICVYGYHMYVHQALAQLSLWFKHPLIAKGNVSKVFFDYFSAV